MNLEKEIAWDLTELFPGSNHPKIAQKQKELQEMAENLVLKYKGKINNQNFSANDLLKLFQEEEKFFEEFSELRSFSELNFSANMTIPENQELHTKITNFLTDLQKKVAFLSLEIGKYVNDHKNLLADPILENYKHHLEILLRKYPHQLSEIEEQLILEKDQFGIEAWSQIQGSWLNTRMIDVEIEGEKKTLPYGKANGLLSHPDRKTRTSVNKGIYGLLGKENEIFSTALRNICGDWLKTSKRRNYDSPMHQSLISSDLEQPIVDNLMKTIEKNVGVYQDYLNYKASLMKLPKLGCEDIVAPLPDSSHKEFSWETTKDLIFQAYGNFDEEFKDFVEDMYAKNHIDATPRYGKRNGAFCSDWYKGASAFILASFNNDLISVYTLAHELGHAIHAYYNIKNNSILNTDISMVVAETASIFGELLMTDLLLNEPSISKSEKQSILTHILDEAGMAIFQVSARVWFEQSLYDSIENEVHLDGETISKLWTRARNKIYGDSVDWFDEMRWEWAMKPHYFIPNFRFYNYPYVYAQLFVFALYQVYRKEGKEFIKKFKKILSAGSTLSPKEIGEIIGF
ncbi:MAG: M3 family metallopeptidase, partial [Promethearchaeota archaeon]